MMSHLNNFKPESSDKLADRSYWWKGVWKEGQEIGEEGRKRKTWKLFGWRNQLMRNQRREREGWRLTSQFCCLDGPLIGNQIRELVWEEQVQFVLLGTCGKCRQGSQATGIHKGLCCWTEAGLMSQGRNAQTHGRWLQTSTWILVLPKERKADEEKTRPQKEPEEYQCWGLMDTLNHLEAHSNVNI